jgi:anaerobic ribonucleoside-triphosphate reductase activating protein
LTGQTQTIQINRVHYPVTVLGYGTRLGIWVQGCPLACRGCMSRDTWAKDAGIEMSVHELAQLWRRAVDLGADGVTISGGEPLAQPAALAQLLTAIATIRTELTRPGGAAGREQDILVYTGYEEAEFTAAQRQAILAADVLITGRYDVTAPTRLVWRGSANQRMLLRTRLAARRYASMVDHLTDRASMQVSVDAGGIWFIGVPQAGDMPRLEQVLRRRGVRVDFASWRSDSHGRLDRHPENVRADRCP